jgi:uncharacterized protein YkwD
MTFSHGVVFLLGLATLGTGAAPAARGQETSAPPRASRPPVLAAAAPAEVSRALAAALLAETNRIRRLHHLPPLRERHELTAAADDQAAFLALTLSAQHGSPLRGQETPYDRVRRRGFEPERVAENVASTGLAGDDEEPPTIEAVAALLVEQWMNSPGHRANILSRDMTHFGGAVRFARFLGRRWCAFGVQVFGKPSRRGEPIGAAGL